MLKLAICDDDVVLSGKLEGQLIDAAAKLNTTIETEVFHSGESLTRHLNGGSRFDGIFLDIEMGQMSGVDVGRWVRDKAGDEATKIIYISWERDYAMSLFEVRPMDFLVKPLSEEVVMGSLEKLLKLCRAKDSWFYFKVKNELKRVRSSEIIYLESSNRQVNLVSTEGAYSFYGKLMEASSELDTGTFWQIHKSYIVNIKHVTAFEYESVSVISGRSIPISQSKRKEIRNRQMTLQRGGH